MPQVDRGLSAAGSSRDSTPSSHSGAGTLRLAVVSAARSAPRPSAQPRSALGVSP